MSKKIKTPTVKKVKPWKFILSLNPEEQKQLQIVHKNTAEKTATKAIIKAMYQSDYFMKLCREEQQKVEALQYELSRYKSVIKDFSNLLKVMNELNTVKPGANSKSKKGTQLQVETCDECGEPLSSSGSCVNRNCEESF